MSSSAWTFEVSIDSITDAKGELVPLYGIQRRKRKKEKVHATEWAACAFLSGRMSFTVYARYYLCVFFGGHTLRGARLILIR